MQAVALAVVNGRSRFFTVEDGNLAEETETDRKV